MRVKVIYFQSVRNATRCCDEWMDIDDNANVADLVALLERKHPVLKDFGESLLLAVNEEHAIRSSPLAEGDIVALMPPFSGG